jgi:hypothetical protein
MTSETYNLAAERVLRLEESEAAACQACEALRTKLDIAVAWIADDNKIDLSAVTQRIEELARTK